MPSRHRVPAWIMGLANPSYGLYGSVEEVDTSSSVLITESGWFDREVAWLRAGESKTRWIAFAVFSALVLHLVVVAALSTSVINLFHNDALIFLDDGWRVLNGQVPHRDFNSPLGPVESWLVGAGMMLSHGDARGIAFGTAAFGLALGVWSWLLCRDRLPVILALLATAWIVLTATCPSPLGFGPHFLSCAMIYNRQGYALLGIILVECAFALERSRFIGGLSSGVAFIALVFLKLNFFVIAALLLLVTILITRFELSRILGLLTGTAAGLLALLLYPRFSFEAFFNNMLFVAHARGSSLNLAGLFQSAVTCAGFDDIWLVAAITLAMFVLVRPAERRQRAMIMMALISLVVLASGPLFLATNAFEDRCQLASLWLIILLDRMSALHLRERGSKTVTVVLIATSLGGIGAVLLPEASSTLSLLTYQSASRKASGVRVDAPGMEKVTFYDSTSLVKEDDGGGTYYVSCLNDGLALLEKQSKQDESVLVLGFYNPFSYLLRHKPAEGGSSFLFVGNSISEKTMPPESWVFGNADLMILPDYESSHRISDQFIQNYYRSYLEQNFHFVAKSQYWSLYRRNHYQAQLVSVSAD